MVRLPLVAAAAVVVVSVALGRSMVFAPSGERVAESSIEFVDGKVSITYRTLFYGQQTMNDVLASAQERDFYNRALWRKIQGKLESNCDLLVDGAIRLPAGEHLFSLVVMDDNRFGVQFGKDGTPISLEVQEAPWVFTNLSCLLCSDGAEDLSLVFVYGEMLAQVKLGAAPQEERK